MPFRLKRETRKWFQDISSNFEVDFDMYYLCLIASLASGGKKGDAERDEATDLVDSFPGAYKEKSRVIIALFLASEIERLGIASENREAVYKQIRQLVDPQTPSQLSDTGMKLMNQMSFGGFDLLTEQFEDRPRSLEAFLVRYHEIVNAD